MPLPGRPLRKGRRVFGAAGAGTSLPGPPVDAGYAAPGGHAHCPQGLASCLCELEPRLPSGFGLRAAAGRPRALSVGNAVACGRGRFSCGMLPARAVRGQDAVFRLRRDADAETVAFPAGPLDGRTAGIRPDGKAPARLKARHPGAASGPLKPGPGRCAAGGAAFAPGATLTEDVGFAAGGLAAVHRARWRLEGIYRIAKRFPAVESFRAGNGRGVLQEPCAGSVMVTAARLTASGTDGETSAAPGAGHPKRADFRNAAAAAFRSFEALAPARADALAETVPRIVDGVAALRQRERPGRSCPGMSRKPGNKWSRKGKGAAAG